MAQTLRCSRASVYAWAAAWRRAGVAGLREGDHGGGRVKLDAGGEAVLTGLLAADPQARGYQATGWTVPLLRTELAQAGCRGRRAHDAPRLAPAGVSLETAAVRAGTPRSRLCRKKGAVIAQAAAMLAAGGEVWVADETALREFPPLRAGWSKRGAPAMVLISGRNPRRTILGALNVRTRRTGAHGAGALPHRRCAGRGGGARGGAPGGAQAADLGQRPAPPPPSRARCRGRGRHHPGLPALPLPGADAVGGLVARAEGDRGRQPLLPSLEELTQRAVAWLDDMSDAERLRRCGFEASKFDWLPTYAYSRSTQTDEMVHSTAVVIYLVIHNKADAKHCRRTRPCLSRRLKVSTTSMESGFRLGLGLLSLIVIQPPGRSSVSSLAPMKRTSNERSRPPRQRFPAGASTPRHAALDILFRAGEEMLRRKEEFGACPHRSRWASRSKTLAVTFRRVSTLPTTSPEKDVASFGVTTPSESPQKQIFSVRVPVGVVGAISPFNFPFAIPALKSLPALIAGNTMVLKPAQDTPHMANLLAQVYESAGLPAGVFNVVHGRGAVLGRRLAEHSDVPLVSFTGSKDVGVEVTRFGCPCAEEDDPGVGREELHHRHERCGTR